MREAAKAPVVIRQREEFWRRDRESYYDRELTVVAESNVDGTRRLMGVARLVSDVSRGRAEFAVLVGDPWQGKGLENLLIAYCLKNIDRT